MCRTGTRVTDYPGNGAGTNCARPPRTCRRCAPSHPASRSFSLSHADQRAAPMTPQPHASRPASLQAPTSSQQHVRRSACSIILCALLESKFRLELNASRVSCPESIGGAVRYFDLDHRRACRRGHVEDDILALRELGHVGNVDGDPGAIRACISTEDGDDPPFLHGAEEERRGPEEFRLWPWQATGTRVLRPAISCGQPDTDEAAGPGGERTARPMATWPRAQRQLLECLKGVYMTLYEAVINGVEILPIRLEVTNDAVKLYPVLDRDIIARHVTSRRQATPSPTPSL